MREIEKVMIKCPECGKMQIAEIDRVAGSFCNPRLTCVDCGNVLVWMPNRKKPNRRKK